jgi:CHAT domain-containing protein
VEIARQGVPAVLGFRWDLNDRRAAAFADIFYDHLIRDKMALGGALTEARRQLWKLSGYHNSVWAAPILILQSRDWHDAWAA